ncbi:hypothetical protein G6F22_014364 [Rhizopus arrhizus]|nr:hypothetical protein G6F22_014364 [Rhizopus arrhizus]
MPRQSVAAPATPGATSPAASSSHAMVMGPSLSRPVSMQRHLQYRGHAGRRAEGHRPTQLADAGVAQVHGVDHQGQTAACRQVPAARFQAQVECLRLPWRGATQRVRLVADQLAVAQHILGVQVGIQRGVGTAGGDGQAHFRRAIQASRAPLHRPLPGPGSTPPDKRHVGTRRQVDHLQRAGGHRHAGIGRGQQAAADAVVPAGRAALLGQATGRQQQA